VKSSAEALDFLCPAEPMPNVAGDFQCQLAIAVLVVGECLATARSLFVSRSPIVSTSFDSMPATVISAWRNLAMMTIPFVRGTDRRHV
jgi:hypothetical protein